ncbi:restriction endonuclease subunit S [Gloeocapsopsis crepidinum LEGE 06123]|uniref:Restriction endonuclease subunit S n=1 Tax=Gloeocapsopsis crepidinum LEGE 06123 TaxID=588587 RepID=A0ABR9USM9_9CHRO|nr:restriction endonuclease subunit S [Gloeocapsopsis crepidinum]MBE9191307.1 restriction endonuclease subunit S [Gloeocapsopsis crepidinum LEGE 06123]
MITSVSLSELVTIRGGGTPDRQNPDYWNGNIPWASVKDLKDIWLENTQEFITEKGVKNSATNIIPTGTVVLVTRMAVGRACITKMPVAINQDLKALFCSSKLLPQYLLWFLIWASEKLENQASGATVKGIKIDALNQLKIPLLPLEEQRRIAAILDKADDVRRKRQQAIALTEELLRSAFLEMFGDPVTNPKGWEVVELQQVCHRVTDGTHQPPEWATEGIPFLFVSNIVNGEINFNVSKYITDKSWASLTARCPIEVNDILYTTVGSYGNAALVRTEKRFCFQRHIAHIKPDPGKIHPEFLLGLMQSDGVKKQADRQVRGVAQKTLNLRELKKFQITVPPRIYQEQYVAFQKKIESCRNNQQNCFKRQDALFNSLLQRAFRGEL